MSERWREAFDLGLVGWELLKRPEADRVCNGIGPSFFPEALRALLDRMHPSLRIVADIHDMGYWLGDGTVEDWEKRNDEFRMNGRAVAKARYGFWNPARYKVMWDAGKFARLCGGTLGRMAYNSAVAERRKEEQR